MANIMLDIETVANSTTSAVIQISMIKFDWNKEKKSTEELYLNLDLDEQLKKGLDINSNTLIWWTETNPELFKKILTSVNCSVTQALNSIKDFVKFNDFIWCHATFDIPILNNLFNVYGIKAPWAYTKVRDIRTLVDLSGIDLKQYDWKKEKTHDSLDDCRFQIKYCQDAYEMLKNNK